ncbi:hypothetical protein [Pelagibacterium lacus]|uniref:Uncharacterized protein n=1 Tax=Pelagibacterium lacus TaxID=2282655 RepID=A0A369WB10_9HYPH|nr:hypothetical protein [Pelagibacterium lacus]RDE10580.1 hypothetical protein DVH29_01115 [Pelagibacterium lacus]
MLTHRPARQERSIALRYRAGLAVALMLAAIMAASMAHADAILTTSPPPLSTLVKFDDRQYEISYSQDVSLEPTQSAAVRKIGFGAVSMVNIATTATGTYSSDGLTSPHIRYPGISVSAVLPEGHGKWRPGPGVSIFSLEQDYTGGLSFTAIGDRGVRSCMTRGSFTSCYRTY